jgi:hypothetical protein
MLAELFKGDGCILVVNGIQRIAHEYVSLNASRLINCLTNFELAAKYHTKAKILSALKFKKNFE